MGCKIDNHIGNLKYKNVIYGLIDPTTNEIRYIGKAIDLYTRIRNHYKPSRLISKTHKNNWINKLLNDGEKPLVVVLEIINQTIELNDAEIKWIKHYKDLGCDLTNGTEGGDGGKMSPESIEKMKLTKNLNKQEGFWLNKKFSDEHKKNISESKKGKEISEETKLKLSESHKGLNTWTKGKVLSEVTKNKMSESRTGVAKNTKKVSQLDLDGNLIKIWENPYSAEKELELSRGKIHSVCIGERKTTGGFKWKYLE